MALITGILHEDAKKSRRHEVVLDTISVSRIKEMATVGGLHGVELRIVGRDGHWYRVRQSGQIRLWKRDAHRVELPVKYGMYESITLTTHDFESGKVAVRA